MCFSELTHAVFVLQELLAQAGATVISLGAEQNAHDVAEAAQRHAVDAILITTSIYALMC